MILSALSIASCGSESSFVVVTVTSGVPLTVTALDVTVASGAQAARLSITHGTSFTIPPDDTFAIKFEPSRSGDILLDVRALDGASELARAMGATSLVPGRTANVTLMLLPPGRDLLVLGDSESLDLAATDASVPDGAVADTNPAEAGTSDFAIIDSSLLDLLEIDSLDFSPVDIAPTDSTPSPPDARALDLAEVRDLALFDFAKPLDLASPPDLVPPPDVAPPPDLSITNVLVWYRFDDGQGKTAADSTGHGFAGTLAGNATWTQGRSAGAVQLDGQDAYVGVPPLMLASITDFSIALWFKASGVGAGGPYLFDGRGNGIENSAGPILRISPNRIVANIEWNDTLDTEWIGQIADPGTQWHSLAMVRQGSAVTLYYDGVLLPTMQQAQAPRMEPFAFGGPKRIGGYSGGGGFFFNGAIDEFRIVARALSASEVKGLFEKP